MFSGFMDRIAAGLEARGIRRGDRVGILMENVPHWVFALLGILRIGGVVVPLAPALPESSLQRLCTHCTMPSRLQLMLRIWRRRAASNAEVILLPSEEFLECRTEVPLLSSRRGMMKQRSSFTRPARPEIPKASRSRLFNLAHEIRGVAESFELSDQHRILSVLPFSHVLPLVANGLGPLCIGAAVVFLSSISPQRIVESFHKHRITFFVCVPQFFYVLHKRIFSQVEAQPFILRKVFEPCCSKLRAGFPSRNIGENCLGRFIGRSGRT